VDKTVVTVSGVSVTDKIYDGKESTYTGEPTAEGATGTSTYAYTWQKHNGTVYVDISGNTAPKNAGKYRLVVALENIDFMGQQELNFEIAQKSLVVRAEDKEQYQYHTPLPTPTFVYEGFIEGESETLLTVTTAFAAAHTAADSETAGEDPITMSGAATA
ncbi:MAG: hypothetical protein RR049_08110, partial [Angelakisella sp.]